MRTIDTEPPGRLLRFETTDRLILPGILFEPPRRASDVAVFLHGNGDSSVFYAGRTSHLARELTQRGIAFFAFNNRGALQVKSLTRVVSREESEPVRGGMAFELIRDCVHDIDGVSRFLRTIGFERIHLIGYSTGANKICLYDSIKRRNTISSYVLMAPGDDVGIYYDALGAKRFEKVLERSREMVRRGRGDEFAPPSVSPFLISWRSLLDTIDPEGDYNVFPFLESLRGLKLSRRKRPFAEYGALRKPSIALIGSDDQYCFGDVPGCVELLRRHASKRLEGVEVIDGADHGFHRREEALGAAIGSWIRRRRRAARR
jgi:pimeloyl-ACP methyl ester carboxylesterase